MNALELRKFRRKQGDRGLSQTEMAKALGVSYSCYRTWESGEASDKQQETARLRVEEYKRNREVE